MMKTQWWCMFSPYFLYLRLMQKRSKVYKPGKDEILKQVLQSFEIENIIIASSTAKAIFKKVLSKTKKVSG
ncbi:MAG: hypothetical protein IPG01_00125 [Chitinophagaceae bacterium]|nr:hypothetical protein [Chitinophagaceae bacterium]